MDTRVDSRLAAPSHGSRTTTALEHQPDAAGSQGDASAAPASAPPSGVLRLRGGPRSAPRVSWDEDVVDNEGCNKKKSKICCIYHKPRRFDESSDESSSESDSDSESGHEHAGRPCADGHKHKHARKRGRNTYEAGGDKKKKPAPINGDGNKSV